MPGPSQALNNIIPGDKALLSLSVSLSLSPFLCDMLILVISAFSLHRNQVTLRPQLGTAAKPPGPRLRLLVSERWSKISGHWPYFCPWFSTGGTDGNRTLGKSSLLFPPSKSCHPTNSCVWVVKEPHFHQQHFNTSKLIFAQLEKAGYKIRQNEWKHICSSKLQEEDLDNYG